MVFQLFGKNRLGNRKDELGDLPIYNAAPMQRMPVVTIRDGDLTLQKMQWWLVPHWSKDGRIKVTTFNAKAETLEKSKLFAPYFKASRCLVPADAFYEWKKIVVQKEIKGKMVDVQEKQPMCIRMKDKSTFMLAGLFSIWTDEKGEEFPSFTIITTTPNKLMTDIHTRMPVILKDKNFDEWLDRDNKNIEDLKKLLISYPASQMEAFAVSKYVSNSRNEGPECMKRIDVS